MKVKVKWRRSREDGGTYVHDGDGLCTWITEILDHVLDEHGALSDLAGCDEESVRRRSAAGEERGRHLPTVDSTLSELRSLTICVSCSSAIVLVSVDDIVVSDVSMVSMR